MNDECANCVGCLINRSFNPNNISYIMIKGKCICKKCSLKSKCKTECDNFIRQTAEFNNHQEGISRRKSL